MIIASNPLGNGHAIEYGWRGNELDLGILLLERLDESREAIFDVIFKASRAASQPVFIADFNISDLPWAFVPEDLGANATPVCGGVAGKELELVESALDGLVDARFGEFATVESKAAPDSQDWRMILAFACFPKRRVKTH